MQITRTLSPHCGIKRNAIFMYVYELAEGGIKGVIAVL